ncbi:MAG: hydrogenase nickel incorporation protein HypB [Aquabacterium sp.]|nr:hydrogenase nickel incorporation protein HypB [Aquabacterium sp.]
MCLTCGCGHGEAHLEGDGELHTHADGTVHRHAHGHVAGGAHDHGHAHDLAHAHGHVHDDGHGALHFGVGAAGASAPGMTQSRLVQIERDILAKNDDLAQRNRATLAQRGVFALNLVSSPGSGKTSLLVRTIELLAGQLPDLPVAVVEGDQQTTNDADRIRATGAPALQINTGKGCHLDAAMVATAIDRLAPPLDSVLMIENVGNLVCPAGFDLGEAHKVVVLSVTEGEDKPLKYPDMFHAASLMLLNKVDLLPYLRFDVEACLANARRVNPGIQILQVSATTDAGMDGWLDWIAQGAHAARQQRLDQVTLLQRRVADLEATVARLQPP